ncbi:MAG TPA: CsbD family protein [Actinomycetota bacterium]|nr:CsbD family protein [Actinomycetota bacterium]
MGLEDKAEAGIDKAKGKAKEAIGKTTDDRSMEAEGHIDQAKGGAKQAWEHVKDAAKG